MGGFHLWIGRLKLLSFAAAGEWGPCRYGSLRYLEKNTPRALWILKLENLETQHTGAIQRIPTPTILHLQVLGC